jgi:transcription elongation GreA/GreB family factor
MIRWTKTQLRDELLAVLGAQVAVAERAHQASLEGATHEEAKPENDKDTRALEQSYLARGQAQRLMELKEAMTTIQLIPTGPHHQGSPCALGSIVQTEDEGQTQTYWIASTGGGTRLAQGSIQVVSPKSPLGRALVGSLLDDDCEVQIAGSTRTLSIVAIS